MRENSGWIDKLIIVGLVFAVLAGGFWWWDRNSYPLPRSLDPMVDPFSDPPPEYTPLQTLVGRLRAARYDRYDRIEQENEETARREREENMVRGFREFQLAGNRFYFDFYPADDRDGASGEFSLSDASEIQNLESEGGTHPLSNGVRMIRGGDKVLVLKSPALRTKWELSDYDDGYFPSELPPGPYVSKTTTTVSPFPITPVYYGKKMELSDGDGNRLTLWEWTEPPKFATPDSTAPQ